MTAMRMGAQYIRKPRNLPAEQLILGLSGRRCALTGARGYLGRRLGDELTEAGCELRELVLPAEAAAGEPGVVAGDVRDPAALAELVRGADVVFHLAAFVHRRPRSAADRSECFDVNVGGTRAVLEACRRSPQAPFLVVVSSSSVYGRVSGPADEGAPCRPQTPYGESKLEAERIVLEAVRRGDVRACVLRPGVFFGRGAPGNLGLLARMLRARVEPVVAGGAARKSIAHVSTVVEALALVAAARDRSSGTTLNVGERSAVSVAELTAALARALGVRPLKLPIPGWPLRRAASLWDRTAGRLPGVPDLSAPLRAFTEDSVLSTERLRELVPFEVRLSALDAIEAGEF
jgi:nucleoside-diphosphate-sugar epimerase